MDQLLVPQPQQRSAELLSINTGGGGNCEPSALQLPNSRGVTVYSAAPGSGKSYHTRHLIKRAFEEGKLHRVIWAVHSTQKRDGLGIEAQRAFNGLGIKTTIVQGYRRVSARNYRRQMKWGPDPEVKIIAFSHLPQVFARHTLLSRMEPQLLVIDECPTDSLLLTAQLSTCDMQRLVATSGGPLARRLSDLAAECARQPGHAEAIRFPTDQTRQGEQFYFSGESFLAALLSEAGPDDVAALRGAVGQLRHKKEHVIDPSLLSDWAEALEFDLTHPEEGSHRFGLRWRTHKNFSEVRPEFYSSVRIPLSLPPTLILDAYPDEAMYRALFKEHDVAFQYGEPARPLKIEVADCLRVRPHTLSRASLRPHRIQIAEEVVLLQHQTTVPLTVLVNKALHAESSAWAAALRFAQGHLGKANIHSLHHYAGRGINGHRGNTLVALTLAHLPRSVEICDLAALFPYDSERRKATYRHLIQAERLQMFHRSRQAQTGARIISAFDPELPPELCELSEYRPLLPFMPGSSNPRLRTAMKTVVEELVSLGGGVPRSSLVGLGLAIGELRPDKIELHAGALRAFLRLKNLSGMPVLRSWFEHDHLGRFQGVTPYRKRSGALMQDILTDCGLQSTQRNHSVYHDGQLLRTQIWVKPGVEEKVVLKRFYPESKP